MRSSKLGIRRGHHLSIEGIRKGYLLCQKWYKKGKGVHVNLFKNNTDKQKGVWIKWYFVLGTT